MRCAGVELATVDARFEVRGDAGAAADVVIVGIDDKTLGHGGGRSRSTASATREVIEQLDKAGASVIAYDVQFTEPSDDAEADDALFEAVRDAPNVVLATDRGRAGRHDGDLRRR